MIERFSQPFANGSFGIHTSPAFFLLHESCSLNQTFLLSTVTPAILIFSLPWKIRRRWSSTYIYKIECRGQTKKGNWYFCFLSEHLASSSFFIVLVKGLLIKVSLRCCSWLNNVNVVLPSWNQCTLKYPSLSEIHLYTQRANLKLQTEYNIIKVQF